MTDPSPIKLAIELNYCRYCRGFLLENEQEIPQGFHHDCHTDIEAYSKLFVHESALLKQLEVLLGEPIPQISELSWDTFGYGFENGKITDFGLFERKLKHLPEALWQLTNLQTLGLSNNQLETVSEALGQLTNLIYLDLSNNKQTTLPKAIKWLIKLEYLYLSKNTALGDKAKDYKGQHEVEELFQSL